jgi:hypothetical protein
VETRVQHGSPSQRDGGNSAGQEGSFAPTRRPDEFTSESPGRLFRSVMRHWTFQPDPLPLTIASDLRLMSQLSRADQALGELPRPAGDCPTRTS